MPTKAGGYGSKELAGETATELKRATAGMNVSYNNRRRMPDTRPGGGKFGGLPGGPKGGLMNTGGKRRPGRPGPGLKGTG